MAVIPILFADLVRRISESENFTEALETFRTAEFKVDSWKRGGGYHTMTTLISKGITAVTEVAQAIALGGYLDTARNEWLTLLARSWFGLRRREASYTIQTIRVTVAASATPLTVTAGMMWARTATSKRFNNTTGTGVTYPTVIAAGSYADLPFKAESPGASYNVAAGLINALVTAIPGVTVSNLSIATDGLDQESDPELRRRCRARWATLSAQVPGAAYEFWALTLSDGVTARPSVTRAYADIDNPEGVGTVHTYLAGPSGGVDAGVVASTDADLQAIRGISTILTTSSAAEVAINPTGTVWVEGVLPATAQVEAWDVLDAALAELPIGGRLIGGTRGVFRDELETALRGVTGVVRASLSSSDYAMTATQVAVGVASYPNITFAAA